MVLFDDNIRILSLEFSMEYQAIIKLQQNPVLEDLQPSQTLKSKSIIVVSDSLHYLWWLRFKILHVYPS